MTRLPPALLSRRGLLTGGGALALAAAAPRLLPIPMAEPLPAILIPPHMAALVLHGGDAPATAILNRLRDRPVAAYRSDPLSHGGFAATAALLDGARGKALVALLGDGQAVVIESLLRSRAAPVLQHVRYGGQVLLTARL